MAEQQVSIKDFLRKRETAQRELNFAGFNSPFIIREISNDENEKLQNQATVVKINRGQKVRDLNQQKYTETLLVASVVQPDLNTAELQKYYGTLGDPAGTLKKMLSMGELNQLANAVTDLSGLNDSMDDEVQDVKN
ncbi:hypothetical protein [Levilactobacillus brevis]|uniref:phage tail assembly chaperone n=1 Tax=Levilactobacillus brevis TaxID=1580 RepID=UPI0035A2A21E